MSETLYRERSSTVFFNYKRMCTTHPICIHFFVLIQKYENGHGWKVHKNHETQVNFQLTTSYMHALQFSFHLTVKDEAILIQKCL